MSEQMNEQEAKRQAKERDGHKCRFCGLSESDHKKKTGLGLHAHHIIKQNSDGADHPDNLITVCRDCHQTLEKTQADALDRIKDDHVKRELGSLRTKKERLKNEVESLQSETHEIFAWLENDSVELTILVEGVINPDIKSFKDRSKAAEHFEQSENHVNMVTTKVSVNELLQNELRVKSTSNVTLSVVSGGWLEDGVCPRNVDAYPSDVPKELQE